MSENTFGHHWTLYVLELAQGKYYVGITTKTPEIRIQEHINHVRAANWTMMYEPIKIIDRMELGNVSKEEAEVVENIIVRKYIKAKGIKNVRGGDITDKNDLIVRFGYIFDQLTWEAMTIIVLQTITILWLLLDKYNLI